MDDAASKEQQQREARRQRVLARSQGGYRTPIVDLGTPPQSMKQENESADMGGSLESVPAADTSAGPAEAKSGARLASERRRQKILARTDERMAKVHGDRIVGTKLGEEASQKTDAPGTNATLDEMLLEAETEFFEKKDGPDTIPSPSPSVTESKVSRPEPRSHSKPSTGTSPSSPSSGGTTMATIAPAARKSAATTKAPSSSLGGKRLVGNKALDKQSFDQATVQHLANSDPLKRGKDRQSSSKNRTDMAGFLVGLEALMKMFLLLMVGAGVGGLLLPQGRAAVDQAKYEVAYRRAAGGETQARMKLQSFLARSQGSQDGLGSGAGSSRSSDEFGSSTAQPRAKGRARDLKMKGPAAPEDEVSDGGIIEAAADKFLGTVNYALRGAHEVWWRVWSRVWSRPGGAWPCVPAIMLALLVRLVVAVSFSTARLALGLPVFPRASGGKQPGMLMGMLQQYVPLVGRVVAVATTVKSVLSDTSLIVGGTVVTVALFLWAEDGSASSSLSSSVLGLFSIGRAVGDHEPHREL